MRLNRIDLPLEEISHLKYYIWQRLISLFMFIAVTILFVTSVPRFLYELMLVPGNPILERINNGETTTDEQLEVLKQSRLNALKFLDSPAALSSLGTIYLIQSRRSHSDLQRNIHLKDALNVLTRSLQGDPINTFAWLKLGAVYQMLGSGYETHSVSAWRNSIETANFEPIILFQRLHLGIALYYYLDTNDKKILGEQFKMSCRWDRGLLRRYGRQQGIVDWLAFLSGDDQELAAYFEEKIPSRLTSPP